MKRAAVLCLLLSGCGVNFDSLEASLDHALSNDTPRCGDAEHVRLTICNLAERKCAEGKPALECEAGRARCEKARQKVADRCMGGAVDSR